MRAFIFLLLTGRSALQALPYVGHQDGRKSPSDKGDHAIQSAEHITLPLIATTKPYYTLLNGLLSH
jgi:hypothetical protein